MGLRSHATAHFLHTATEQCWRKLPPTQTASARPGILSRNTFSPLLVTPAPPPGPSLLAGDLTSSLRETPERSRAYPELVAPPHTPPMHPFHLLHSSWFGGGRCEALPKVNAANPRGRANHTHSTRCVVCAAGGPGSESHSAVY